MILRATESDTSQIHDITARAGVFSQAEIDAVTAMFHISILDSKENGAIGYRFSKIVS